MGATLIIGSLRRACLFFGPLRVIIFLLTIVASLVLKHDFIDFAKYGYSVCALAVRLAVTIDFALRGEEGDLLSLFNSTPCWALTCM